jgi:Transglycosylase SLT domain
MGRVMIAIGFGLFWLSSGFVMYGYSLIRGYDLTIGDIMSPTHFYTGKWPPPLAGNTQIFPTGIGTAGSATTTAYTVTNAPGVAGGDALSGGAPSTAAGGIANTATIRQAAEAYGWQSGGNWNALTHVIAAESGGNPLATNPSSGALGIAQALGHGGADTGGSLGNEYGAQYGLTVAQARQANSGNALQQLRWMLGYIKASYGTPAAAWDHEQRYSWY